MVKALITAVDRPAPHLLGRDGLHGAGDEFPKGGGEGGGGYKVGPPSREISWSARLIFRTTPPVVRWQMCKSTNTSVCLKSFFFFFFFWKIDSKRSKWASTPNGKRNTAAALWKQSRLNIFGRSVLEKQSETETRLLRTEVTNVSDHVPAIGDPSLSMSKALQTGVVGFFFPDKVSPGVSVSPWL